MGCVDGACKGMFNAVARSVVMVCMLIGCVRLGCVLIGCVDGV